jgi:hypothetical protein
LRANVEDMGRSPLREAAKRNIIVSVAAAAAADNHAPYDEVVDATALAALLGREPRVLMTDSQRRWPGADGYELGTEFVLPETRSAPMPTPVELCRLQALSD